jgi:dynein heavy chain, axonemal
MQGQAPIAKKLIDDGVREGHWVFLANCHLMTSWLPTLDKIIEGLPARNPHEDFRLWLSSNPSKEFPIAILQRGLKMTTEPPKGLRANLMRLYNTINEESYTECKTQARRLLRGAALAVLYTCPTCTLHLAAPSTSAA